MKKVSGVNKISLILKKTGVLWVMVLIFVISAVIDPTHFLKKSNLINLLRNVSLNGIIGLGMTFVILTGGIDLSVGSALSVVAVTVATLLKMVVHPFLAVVLGILEGAVIGFFNGIGITKGKLPAFIMTLGTLTGLAGIALIISDGKPVSWKGNAENFNYLGQGSFAGLPVVVWLFAVLLVVSAFVLKYTAFGRSLYAIGDNREASKLCGIGTISIETMAYVISGVFAAIAAVAYISRLNVGGPAVGDGMELDAVAITVIGGTSTSGGVGGVIGTLIGACIIVIISNILNLMGVSAFVQQVVKGAIIILAVLMERMRSSKK